MDTNKKVACLLGPDFEDSELQVPYDRLRGAGFQVDIIGAKRGEELRGKKGQVTKKADRGIDDVKPTDYGALLIPGGYSPDHLRADERFVRFVQAFDATGAPVAAVCHGPQLLASAGLVRGRHLTAWKTVRDDLRQMGADVADDEVVRDRNWITSRQPSDLEAFSRELIQAIGVKVAEEGVRHERVV